MIFIILPLLVMLSFVLGILAQTIIQKFIPRTNGVKIANTVSWLFEVWKWTRKIKKNANKNKNMKVYYEEMSKPLQENKINNEFVDVLVREKKIEDVKKILVAVLQSQERVRQKQNNEKGFSFVNQKVIQEGPARGRDVVTYPLYYVYYQRYLKGEYIPAGILEDVLRLFGSRPEQIAFEFDSRKRLESTFIKTRWIEHKVKENNLKKQERHKIELKRRNDLA